MMQYGDTRGHQEPYYDTRGRQPIYKGPQGGARVVAPEERDNELNNQGLATERSRDPLGAVTFPQPIRSCIGYCWFLLMTLLFVADFVTDIMVLVIYGMDRHMLGYMGAGICIITITGLCCAMMYILHMKSQQLQKPCYMALCLVLNMPFQFGILGKRLAHSYSSVKKCCSDKAEPSDEEWVFAKLKLLHVMLQSAPMMMLNLYTIWKYPDGNKIQNISATISFFSIVLSSVLYEKLRKQRLRSEPVGAVQVVFIFLYKFMVLMARIVAIVSFVHYYGSWLAAMILVHFSMVFVYFVSVYREVWKISYTKILLHSIYCCLAYFPLHNEYRPEGEIMIYYTVFMIENSVMVALPYTLPPTRGVYVQYLPGTIFYKTVTILVLIGSALGIFFMALYYFFFHNSHQHIRSTHLSWVDRICPCLRNEDNQPLPTPSAQPANLYLIENGAQSQDSRARSHDQASETLLDQTGPPPSYHSKMDNSRITKSVDTDLDYSGDYSKDGSDVKVPLTDSDYPPEGTDTDADISRTSPLPYDQRHPRGRKGGRHPMHMM